MTYKELRGRIADACKYGDENPHVCAAMMALTFRLEAMGQQTPDYNHVLTEVKRAQRK